MVLGEELGIENQFMRLQNCPYSLLLRLSHEGYGPALQCCFRWNLFGSRAWIDARSHWTHWYIN